MPARISLLLCGITLATLVHAQTLMEVGDRGVFHLLKGVEIVGQVTAHTESTITVRSLADDEFTFKRSSIIWIRKFSEGERVVSKTGRIAKFKGLYGNLSSGFGFSAAGNPSQHYSATLGYKFRRALAVGGGGNIYLHQVGVDDGFVSIGMYGEIMGYLSEGYILPYYVGRLGYGSAITIEGTPNNTESSGLGGLHAAYGMGVEFASKQRVRTTIEITQVYQRARLDLAATPQFYQLNRTMFTIGLAF